MSRQHAQLPAVGAVARTAALRPTTPSPGSADMLEKLSSVTECRFALNLPPIEYMLALVLVPACQSTTVFGCGLCTE
jgi:hypothetical protein